MKKSSLWDVTVPRIVSMYALLIFGIVWVGFFAILITNQAMLATIWNWAQALPTVLRVMVWLMFLPVMVGLWIWESSWSTPVTVLAIAGMLGWTLLAISAVLRAFR